MTGAAASLPKTRVWVSDLPDPSTAPGEPPVLAAFRVWPGAGVTTTTRRGVPDYLRARYYDPSTGQFISRDPAVAITRQPYAYVGDNPLNMTDPSGLFGWNDVVNAGRGVVNTAMDLAEIPYYAAYYVAYRTDSSLYESEKHVGLAHGALQVVNAPAHLALQSIQRQGLGADAFIDSCEQHLLHEPRESWQTNDDQSRDEGREVPVLPLNIPGGWNGYVPGIHGNGSTDFTPNSQLPWSRGFF